MVSGALIAALLVSLTCDDNPANPVNTGGKKKAYGVLEIFIDQTQSPKSTKVLGTFKNAPTPVSPWETVMTSGECKLVKPRNVQCTDCGSGHVCVDDNDCQAEPDSMTVGIVTIEGYTNRAGTTTATMEPLNGNYQPTGDNRPAYPGMTEGSTITLKAAGNDSSAGFTLAAKSISALEIYDDTIAMDPGAAIDLKWKAAAVPSNSTIFVSIDLSYHGGTAAKIEAECADDGQLTIPALLLDSLATFPIFGHPKLEITRISEGTDPSTNARLVIKSYVLIWLKIPGITSCSDASQCPTGYDCIHQRCMEVK